MGAAADDAASVRAAVMRLSFGAAAEERRDAAGEVARLARADERTKRLLPELGVLPPLLDMLGGAGLGARLAAAGALLELARGTHRNKVRIVQAGLLKKLPLVADDRGVCRSQELALLLLSISSLANTDFPLRTTELLPFLVATLGATDVPPDAKLPCLAALRNLSAKLEHARDVASSGAVRALLPLSLEPKTSEPALAVLGELAAAAAGPAGREAMEAEGEAVPRALLEAMTRHGSARCQERATYLAMVLAHGSRALRRAMRRLGVVQALLEVSLLSSSPLAQRRAAIILRWFKEEGPQSRTTRAHSGPRVEGVAEATSCRDDDVAGEAKGCRDTTVDEIVRRSLDRNMKSILRRATASVDLTNVKLLVTSSSSKSLPC